MNNRDDSTNEWNITTHIGPVSFNILIDSAFFNYSSQQYSERHRHATFEFHFITEGSCILYTDDMQYEVVPDSFYIIRAGVYHMQKRLLSTPLHRYSCKFEFEMCNSTGNDYSEEEIKNFVYILSNTRFFYSKNLKCIKHIIYEIQSELKQKAVGYYTKVQHLFSLLFIGMMREIAMEAKHEFKMQPLKIYRENRISIIENFFELNYNYKATSQELCELLHISSSQLNRILKEKYNMTFKQKHMETQIEYVKDMLINTNIPIREITEKTGYTSEGNFTAFFKRVLGVSPKVFRKQSKLTSNNSQANSIVTE